MSANAQKELYFFFQFEKISILKENIQVIIPIKYVFAVLFVVSSNF